MYLGGTPEEFIAACDRASRLAPAERAERRKKCARWWPELRGMPPCGAWRNWLRSASRPAEPRAGPRSRYRAVVVGAGPTGLSAAYHLGEDSILLEQNSRVGGWCRSIEVDGFTFDFAGHIMFSNEPYVHQLYKMLLGDNVHWQDREAWIYSQNVYTRYPFQGSSTGCPPT